MSLSSTDKKQMRRFGLIAFIFFGALCGLGIWRQKPIPTYLFGILSLLGIGFMTLPAILKPIYDGWLKVAHIIGVALTAVILTLAYYFVITPSGLIKRMFGGRPIPTLPDKELPSYWVTRTETAQPKERFSRRY